MIERAKELRESDAFAPPETMRLTPASAAAAKAEARTSRKVARRWVVAFAIICALLAGFSLLLPYYGIDAMGGNRQVYSPRDVLACYQLWFQTHILPLFDPALANQAGLLVNRFAETHGDSMYTLVINRAVVTVIVAGCGLMLAVSGLLFQAAFRNPLAAPSLLGVSDGVTLGVIIYTMLGHANIADDSKLYLLLVYGLGAATVVVVLLLSRLMSGGRRYNVMDMLLLGTVICQLLAGVNSFVQNFVMDEYQWEGFYNVQQAGDALVDPLIQGVFVVIFVVTLIPALLLRFRFNMISFSNEFGTMAGVRTGLLRGFALVLGSAMQLAAMATIGQVAMLSLAVPVLVRYMMPADFRSQFLGNCLVGVAMLLACVAIQHFAIIGIVTMPVGTIVSVFIVPFFVWMVALGKGRW